MTWKHSGIAVFLIFFIFVLTPPNPVFSASLPKSTQEMLKKSNLHQIILAGIDKELQVPQEWIEKARKEGKVRVRGTPAVARFEKVFFGPFRERYPFITLEYSGGSQKDRAVQTLVAYKSGRFIGDVVENDLEGTMAIVASGWTSVKAGGLPWALVLIDLCFYTGPVTEASNAKTAAGACQNRPYYASDGYHTVPIPRAPASQRKTHCSNPA